MLSSTTVTNSLRAKVMQSKRFSKSLETALIALLLHQFPLPIGFIITRL